MGMMEWATHGDGEHLVAVRIHHDTLKAGRGHEPLPVAERLEGVMDDQNGVALFRGAVWVPELQSPIQRRAVRI